MSPVLLIDDDVELVGLFADYLEREGFPVGCAHDGESGAREALSGQYAIAVLDVMMPGMSGIATLRTIRTRSAIPVLMLTGRADDADRILGLELGADDYVTKPCTPRELTARLRAILRRAGQGSGAGDGPGIALQVGKLAVYPALRRVYWDGQPVELTSTEFKLLEILARNPGRPVSKHELSEQGLGRPLARYDRNVDVHLSSLRHKLGRMEDGRSCLQTVYRLGYQLLR
ncbi:DNA-binding response regulator [Massilia sp. KIM]|uniref:response regulator transcription factor n=1 Tax=Massilia sp. KIM TaxID=1955422 RepID=UPI00098F4EA4|nr:response regulator transcription factor [Massilia sp. KIM]OON63189.1 DNA-binding response regulator [Massilia sp. KIM]